MARRIMIALNIVTWLIGGVFSSWAAEIGGAEKSHPRVLMKTEKGEIIVELYPDQAPVTVGNFLRYIRENRFRGASFYRVARLDNQPNNPVKIAVIQGGLGDDLLKLSLPPIIHETTEKTGLRHWDGVISMARVEPGTARGEFFICVGDQPELDFGGKRNPDGQGFAAFGRVISGMETVLLIHGEPANAQYLPSPVFIESITVME